MTDHYQTLGVDRNATPDDIKRAYRRMASQHHPDKGGDKNKFQEIQAAYETLSDPQRRAQHDNPSPFGAGSPFGTHSGFDFENIFSVFGARFNQPHQRMQQQARMSLWVTLQDVAMGGKKTISVGTHQGTMTVEIEMPQGINDGDSVQYAKICPNGMDLIITFRIHPDPRWQRQGPHLHAEHTVSIWDLIIGTEVPVKDILGNNLSLTISPGTQPGTILRLKGRGLSQRGGPAGDLLIHVQATIPNNINSELLDAIKKHKQ